MTMQGCCGRIVLSLLLATIGLAGTASGDEYCESLITQDPSAVTRNDYATLIAEAISQDLLPSARLQVSDIEVYRLFKSGAWIAVYGSMPTADVAIFVFEKTEGSKHFRDVWGSRANPLDVSSLTEWAEQLEVPEDLAACLAQFTNDGSPVDQQFGFKVNVSCTDDAISKLTEQSEEIVVAAADFGAPTPEGQAYADDVGRIELGTETITASGDPAKLT
ncbi:hypothetical protein [Pelagibacterium sp. H642]|uniref:hypothetical protein n=1 Tax=Pelagibacterium sp. H642 TaxID=1881069 RepID=UPI002814D2EA|nr:hypothetical protein [Pelagibacterium sp. H642]WMT91958.1 hypothetical protein NO934_06800 [Pelagibacterium sp. H642]